VAQTKRQNDFTGRQMQAGVAKAAEEKRIRAEQVAAEKAAEDQEFADSVFDLTQNPDQPIVVDEVVEVGVEMANDSVVVRVSETIENMTVGYRNTYHFKAGGKYLVPKDVADRLEELGLLWH
jgi:methylmalonyl-CoA mutase N-terminal domain/subunit